MKHPTRWLPYLLAFAILAAACGGEDENRSPPDQLLQDSLGLSADEDVHRVMLRTDGGAETAVPDRLALEPGDWVEFFTSDRRVRTVSFQLESLTPEQAEFLRASGQDRSPPLIELDSRFVVSFEDAPAGTYRYTVEGTGTAAFGSIEVQPPPE